MLLIIRQLTNIQKKKLRPQPSDQIEGAGWRWGRGLGENQSECRHRLGLEYRAIMASIDRSEISLLDFSIYADIKSCIFRWSFSIASGKEIRQLGCWLSNISHQQFHFIFAFWCIYLIFQVAFTPSLINRSINRILYLRSGTFVFSSYISPWACLMGFLVNGFSSFCVDKRSYYLI